jgi:Domain of unknown function (DUF4124)
MNPPSIRIAAARILAAALLALAGPAPAQTIYKYERPDGTFLYTDKPVKGGRLVERFNLAQAPATPSRQAQARPPAEAPRSEVPSENPVFSLDAADAEVRAAQKAVDGAKARLEQGAEPLPGERTGNVGGKTSRLNEGYFARQQQLEQDLKDANERLDQAYQRRNQAK